MRVRVRQDVRQGERARARDRGRDRGDRSFDRFRRILSMDRDRLARRRRRARPVQMAARQSPGWSSCVAAPGGGRVVGSHLAELRHEVLRVLDHVLGAQALGGGLGGGLAVRAGGGRQRDLAREAARGGSRGAQNASPRIERRVCEGWRGRAVRATRFAIARGFARAHLRAGPHGETREPVAGGGARAAGAEAHARAPGAQRDGFHRALKTWRRSPGVGARETRRFFKAGARGSAVRSLWNDSTTPFEVRRDAIRRRGGVAKAARPRPRRARVLTGRGGANPDKRNPPRNNHLEDGTLSRLSSARAGRGFAFCR